MSMGAVNLSRFLVEHERQWGIERGLQDLLNNIAFASKIVSREVNKAGLVEILGLTGETNVQGEEVQKLDMFAEETFIHALEPLGLLAIMTDEEQDEIIPIPDKFPTGPYVFLFDPLDGSSNIDANVSIGTIFAIYRKISKAERGVLEDCLQPGNQIEMAGYVIYGSSTMLVFSCGHGVHGFTLDPSCGEFLLSHPDICMPEKTKNFSVNEGNYFKWEKNIRNYIDYCKTPDKESGRPYSGRYIGSLVADFHRNLLYGGIFLYPGTKDKPGGKLRLLYEGNPLSYIAEQAGGAGTTGTERILDIKPDTIHQRIPLIIGPKKECDIYDKFAKGKI
ncbi:MAG: class 1 fructose-bisphosphatase [Planctomycetota bacterium]|nr:MAG: class 1 fructose-bisphosphatase [Planctomycetota bacterium]